MDKKFIELDKGQAEGFRIDLDNAPLILVKAKEGMSCADILT